MITEAVHLLATTFCCLGEDSAETFREQLRISVTVVTFPKMAEAKVIQFHLEWESAKMAKIP